MMTRIKINEANWTAVASHGQEGAYSYRTGCALLRRNRHPDCYCLSRWGFRWVGNSGSAYRDYYSVPSATASDLQSRIEAITSGNGGLVDLDIDVLDGLTK